MFKSKTKILALSVLTLLGACAQGRRTLGSGSYELWTAQEICDLGCFSIQLNITKNQANIGVESLPNGYDGTSYRVLARPSSSNQFFILKEGITSTVGQSFSVSAPDSIYIEEFEEWRIELSENYDGNGFLAPADPLQGLALAQGTILWPELVY